MCGRFALNNDHTGLQEWYDTQLVPNFAPRYNIAPGSPILALREAPDGRRITTMRWGLIPSWAKDPKALPMLHNARGETIAEKPMFRQAFKKRRCIIPATGFYEWKAVPGQRSKQPFFISMRDGCPMSFAGLWETSRNEDGEPVDTCTIVTTEANEVLEPIHHRMPLILHRDDWQEWLNPELVEPAQLLPLVKPFDGEAMRAWGVSHAVNKVINDDGTLVLPIA
jgi:putative SOS response-associated peptidase YedK